MEWKNDVLMFSGFDYGVAEKKREHTVEELFLAKNDIEEEEINDEEYEEIRENDGKEVELKNIRSLNTFLNNIKKRQYQENDPMAKDFAKFGKGIQGQFKMEKPLDIDLMKERKIENEHFWNIEQAEKRINEIVLRKFEEEGVQITNRMSLKPILLANPWHLDEEEVEEIEDERSSYCVIS